MPPAPEPLVALAQLEAWLSSCSQECPANVEFAIDAIRAGLRERLARPEDALEAAAAAVQRAEAELRNYHGSHTAAIIHELAQAAASIARARQLRG